MRDNRANFTDVKAEIFDSQSRSSDSSADPTQHFQRWIKSSQMGPKNRRIWVVFYPSVGESKPITGGAELFMLYSILLSLVEVYYSVSPTFLHRKYTNCVYRRVMRNRSGFYSKSKEGIGPRQVV